MAIKKFVDEASLRELIAKIKELNVAGDAIEIDKTGANHAISVKYDNSAIILDSEGRLTTSPSVGKVQDVKVRLASDGSYISVLDSEGNAKVDLSSYSIVTETGNKLDLSVDSEYKLTASLKDKFGTELSTSTVDLPIEEMIVKIEYFKDSEGKGWLKFTLKNGSVLWVEITDIIDGLVTQHTEQTIDGKKDFTGGLLKNNKEVLSVENVDNKTIKVDSEGNLTVITKELQVGDAIEITSEGVINVLYDNTTIYLDSEGKLAAKADGVAEKVLEKIVDPSGDSAVAKDSEGHLVINTTNLYQQILTSEGGLIVDSEGKLEVDAFTAAEVDTIWDSRV